jgi:hypothetical protein
MKAGSIGLRASQIAMKVRHVRSAVVALAGRHGIV